jgi:serine/threonine protein kinase
VRLAKILKYIHYEALANFRSKERGEEQKQKIAIIHRDVKPQNIVFMNKDGKDMSSIYLLDFGIAKIGYSELLKGYNNCGTSYYKAPEIGEGRIYNAKVDVYGFGCTLFEIINEGERLILTSAISNKYGDRERYIKSRLVDLHQKLLKTQKLKNPYYWIQLLHNCLAYDVKKRYSS